MATKLTLTPRHQTTYPAISPERPELKTTGKNALVTGGGSGIGASIARSLGKSGISNIALLGRTEATLNETKAQIEKDSPGTKVWIYVVDLVNAAATNAAFASYAKSIQGKIDILIPNAGYISDVKPIVDSDADDWWWAFEVSVRGNFNTLRAFQPHAAPRASIVHVSSAVIYLPYFEGYSSYCASKLAAWKIFDYYKHENPDFFVLNIHPGLIGGTGLAGKIDPSAQKYGLEYDDVALSADFVVWALSEEAAFLNGRYVEAAWDVDEIKALAPELEKDSSLLTIGLLT